MAEQVEMEIKNYIITFVSIFQVAILIMVAWNYTKKILPHVKEEHRSNVKLSILFNTGIKKDWVDEEGWILMKRQGWFIFFGVISIPIVWFLISIVW